MRRFFFLTFLALSPAFALAKPSFNGQFVGTWSGTASLRQICSGPPGAPSERAFRITVDKPKLEPGKYFKINVRSGWGCFGEMTLPGFIFGDELWAASHDRMTFVKLTLQPDHTLSGDFRFDLDNHTLKTTFAKFRKVDGRSTSPKR